MGDVEAAARQEAKRFWPRSWFYIGHAAAIPEPGDLLPFTIAAAGLHVLHDRDGQRVARMNRAQQGGCITIPQQCHGGTQLHCPQSACAFSRDRLPAIGAATPDRDRLWRQFIGDRAEHLPRLALHTDSGFLRLCLAPSPPPIDEPPAPFSATPIRWWREIGAPWAQVAYDLRQAAAMQTIATQLHLPNLLRLGTEGQAAIILQPLGPRLTRCRVECLDAARTMVETVLDDANAMAEADGGPEPSLASFVARIMAAPHHGIPTAPLRRANPHFGFIGG